MSDEPLVLIGYHLDREASGYLVFGPFPDAKALEAWQTAQPLALFPTQVLPLREPVDQSWCRHCGDVGPAGSDHTCPCPHRDEDCALHPAATP
jgi:hypothetical protein